MREGLEAKQRVGPDGIETFVLIRSVERREKERAMHERFARRIETVLERLLERNQHAAGRYVIDFVPDSTLRAGAGPEWLQKLG